MSSSEKNFFAPQLYIPHGVADISFYSKAFNATEIRRFTNDDGSIHVAELSVYDCIFHLHEEAETKGQFHPGRHMGVTALIGLFVPDVDAIMQQALDAGAELVSPAMDYDYGYRQGRFRDPFGHLWMIEKKI
jgi:PhnB protein